MKELPRRVRKLAENLGIAPDQVRDTMAGNSRQAAIVVQETLQRFINQIVDTSESGALQGYVAEIIEGDFETVRLPKSDFDITGQFKYLVVVKPSSHHENLGINVFNILDTGRPQLPYKPTEVYPLWQSTAVQGIKQDRILPVASGGKVARAVPVYATAIRTEPRRAYQTPDGKLGFTHGPISGTPAYHLYTRALQAAKDALAGSGFRQWDVIYVGPNPD